jgi:hypothetical protein
MATIAIEPAGNGEIWVMLKRFSGEDIARPKKIPGRQWHPFTVFRAAEAVAAAGYAGSAEGTGGDCGESIRATVKDKVYRGCAEKA